ncbi:hypothetical protein GALMADRAFT_56704 [Galerina marginata CBS 339.88]|uniref:GAR domain-containing protein n=1 Tax=Galerina marginata (strain CBS 339.88) TaxID=685588 RepID=A0A067TJK2_GALM3|nr:hypothetical protein GALMADRAFT_56704 [Galerina marginata CBS 339.88]
MEGAEPSQPFPQDTSGQPSAGEEQALESHEVIELQTFSERKAWIEEKIKFLESLPPIEVFVGLDAIRSSLEDVPGLPTREELQQWMAEHDAIEKETEIFDTGELTKLRQLTKAATQRNLSPEDTDVIELTLTTIYALDKLLHLLRDRSENLEMMSIRLTWEENRRSSWRERRQIIEDLNTFFVTRARWSPSIYEASSKFEDSHALIRRGSIASQASAGSDSVITSPAFSRSARFKLAELLSRDAAQFSGKVTSLKHGKVTSAGKALDRLIDHSRRPVPEDLLDEQDRLEEKCINELDNIGKFTMALVMQWRKADEIYVETMKDQVTASNLLEEIETAKLYHPTARQSTSFISRIDTILKRLAVRGDPASPASLFPRPEHFLFSDQKAANDILVRKLSVEISSANRLARNVDLAAKDYRTAYEAVKRVENLTQSINEISLTLTSILKKFEEGISGAEEDGSPPDLNSDRCLDPTSHSTFLAFMPSLLEDTVSAIDSADKLLQAAPSALFGLNIQGIDIEFKENAAAIVNSLSSLREYLLKLRDSVSERVSRLREARRISSEIDSNFTSLETLKTHIAECMDRDRWQQESGGTDAPPTPESPTVLLSLSQSSISVFDDQLQQIGSRLKRGIKDPFDALCTTLELDLQTHFKARFLVLQASLENGHHLLRLLGMIREQSSAMKSIQNDFHDILTHIEDSKIHIAGLIEYVLECKADEYSPDEAVKSVNLESVEQRVTDFTNALSGKVPFVARHRKTNSMKPTSPSGQIQFPELDAPTKLPFDLTALDAGVRADSNSYAMRLSGAMENLRKEQKQLTVAMMARVVDTALSSTVNEINDLAQELSSQKTSFASIPRDTEDAVGQLQAMLDGLPILRSKRSQIARSLSPTREILREMDEVLASLEPSVRDKLYKARNSEADDIELRLNKWDDEVGIFKNELSLVLHNVRTYLEEVKAAEKRLNKAQEERLAAEEAERLRLENERLKNEKRQRLEEERLAEERRQELERQRIAFELAAAERLAQEAAETERVRLEEIGRQAEATRVQEERVRLAEEDTKRAALEQERIEMVEKLRAAEEQLQEQRRLNAESELAANELARKQQQQMEVLEKQQTELQRLAEEQARQAESERIKKEREAVEALEIQVRLAVDLDSVVETDVFGSQSAPKPHRSQELIDLQSQLFGLRKRFLSIGIKDALYPPKRSAGLPTEEQYGKLHRDISALSFDIKKLPSNVDDDLLNAELKSFKAEVEEAFTMLEKVQRLVAVYEAIQSCDAALSDLLEHIDSYPAIPLSMLSSAHRSVATATSEEQLSARLDFTRDVMNHLGSTSSACMGDQRTKSEHSRIQQTWIELQEMASDRIVGKKSRPTSVISRNSSRSGYSSTSTNPAVKPTVPTYSRGAKKTSSYSHLSVSSVSMPSKGKMLAPPPQHKSRRAISGPNDAGSRSTSRLSSVSTTRSVSGPLNTSLHGSTFASRQRTTSLSNSISTPSRRPSVPLSRTRLDSGSKRSYSPSMSEISSHSRSSLGPSRSTASASTWSRAPRDSFSSILPRVVTPYKNVDQPVRKTYVADPKSKLDVAVGDVVNQLPVGINIEGITESWRDQSGKYWIGNQDPKLCFCRILRSQTVMVRVGGGWTELSRFIKDHFADSFRIAPESPPRLGSQAEKWISSATLLETLEPETPPRTPEPQLPFVPSFSLMTPSGQSPHSLTSSPSNKGSPLTPLQFMRRADLEHSTGLLRPATPSKTPLRNRTSITNTPSRNSIWRP